MRRTAPIAEKSKPVRRASLGVLALALASAVLATAGSASQATFSGPAGKIVLDGGTLINPDGSGGTKIPISGGRGPVWSPDGRWLAYSTYPEPWVIRIVRPDGTSDREILPANAGAPATHYAYSWSPNGSEIAYQCGTGLCAVRVADGTTRRIVDLLPQPAGIYPAWSPTGSRIAFLCRGGFLLCLVNPDGADPVGFLAPPGFAGGGRFPDWSPDGSQIVLTARTEVYVLDVDDGELRLIVDIGGTGVTKARWSPDGKSVLISKSSDVYVMRLDGSSPMKIGGGALGDWGTSPAATVVEVRAEPRWALGRQVGSLLLAGTASHASELQVTIRSEKGASPLISAPAPAGEYRVSVRLPATLLPGAYTVTVGGTSGGERLLDVVRSIQVAAPPSGIVSRSSISTSPGGPARARVPRGTTKLFARFEFAVRPAAGQRLTAVWRAPSGAVRLREKLGVGRVVRSAIVDTAGLPPGRWRCTLEANGAVLAVAAVRVG